MIMYIVQFQNSKRNNNSYKAKIIESYDHRIVRSVAINNFA
jgi:hypothetical protein